MVSIQKGVSLKNLSNYKIGGIAKYFLEVSSLDELKEGLKKWEKISKALPVLSRQGGVFILGGGSNVLISDKGFNGLVIHNNIKDIRILSEKDIKKKSPNISISQYPNIYLLVGSGVLMEDLLAFCIKNSLSGLEWAGGLPGTLGGAVRGNAGAFGGEIKDSVYEVESLNIKNPTYEVGSLATSQVEKRKNLECKFGYRSSVFKSQRERESERKRVREKDLPAGKAGSQEIIIDAVLSLKKGNKENIEKEINEKIEYRKNRHPLEFPNIGSIFKNIPLGKVPQKLLEQLKDSIKNDPFPILPTAKLLATAGLKGKQVGGAMVSQKHPNFIVNLDRATSEDVEKLIFEIKEIIKDKYGITLEEEISVLE